MLVPSFRARERLLAMGGPGSGKTKAILYLARQNPDSTFHVINNDWRFNTVLELGFPDVAERGNVKVTEIESDDWDGWLAEATRIKGVAEPDDWFVPDLIGPTWTAIMNKFAEEELGTSMDDLHIAIDAKASRKSRDLQAYSDFYWPKVSVQTKKLHMTIVQMPCHVYATSQAKEIDGRESNTMILGTYGHLGVRPAGDKDLSYVFDNVLLFKAKREEWTMTTAKVTEREKFEDRALGEFPTSYLIRSAKWKVK